MWGCISFFIWCAYAAAVDANSIRNVNSQFKIGKYLVVLHPPGEGQTKVTYINNFISKISKVSEATEVLQRFDFFESPLLCIKVPEADASKLLHFPEVKVIESNDRRETIQQCASQESGRDLWGLSRIDAREMPDYETATYNYDQSGGDNTRVYILDTGIRITHVNFGGRAVYGINFVVPGADPTDYNGHGTHGAGIAIGAQFGVSKVATVVAVKVLSDSGSGSTSNIVAGVDWAMADIAYRGVRGVLHMAIVAGRNQALNSAVESATAGGVPVVTLAGNNNANACSFSPGGAAGVITVAGTYINDVLDSSSNWGPCVNILAPSRDIRSASHENDFDSRVRFGSSTAFVAGQIANIFAKYPNATTGEVYRFLLDDTTKDVINLGGKDVVNLLLHASCE